MKTPPLHHVPARFALMLLAASPGVGAAEPAGAPEKPYRLFMGSNLTVVSKDAALPVRDVKNNSFVVKSPRGDRVIDPKDAAFRLKIDDALKLTSTYANIENLTFDRIYTAANDPMQKFADAARVEGYMADQADSATAAVRSAESSAGIAATITGADGVQARAMAANQLSNAQGAQARAQANSSMEVFTLVSSSSRLNSEIAAGAFDALRVTFAVSSPVPLKTPYVVIFMRFLEQKERPDTATVWVYAEKLPDLDERPRNITIVRGGFPPGYHIDSYHVHLYEGTSEVATSVSRKQLALTADEAFQFSVIQHISGNRDQTTAPKKAPFFWPVFPPACFPKNSAGQST